MKSISAKMVKAMAAIDAVEKRGRNENQSYQYVRATDVANEVRKVLHECGIAFAYEILEVEHWEKQKIDKDGNLTVGMYYCQIKVRGHFTDSETGETVSGDSVGWGADPLDKAPYKAMTGALKYLLRMTFLIPDETDPENDSAEAPKKAQVQRAPQNLDAEPPRSETTPAGAYSNEFDAHMEKSEPKTYPVPQVGPAITDQQGKKLYAMAMNKPWTIEQYRSFINRLGFKKDREIPAARFTEICDRLKEAV